MGLIERYQMIYKQRVYLLVYLLLCIGLIPENTLAQSMPQVAEPDPKNLTEAVLHRIIDGDSVELFVDGAIIRYELAGADAPDILPDDLEGTEPEALRGSIEAKVQLMLLLEGESIAVYPDIRKRTDRRGNLRAFIYRMPDGLFVNLEMVRLGFSKHARDPLSFNDAAMLWAQDKARDARKGVWAPAPKPTPKPAIVKSTLSESAEESSPVSEHQEPPADPPAASSSSQNVYVTQSGSKYHTKDCRHVQNGALTRSINEVQESHQPCKVCNPDSTVSLEPQPKQDD